MPLHFVMSNKNCQLLKHDGFLFRKDKTLPTAQYWKCVQYAPYECKARVVTSNDKVVKYKNIHNHVIDTASVRAKEVLQDMKERATTTQRTTNEVIADSTVGLEASVAGALPDFNLLKRTVQRKRQIVNHAPARDSPN